MAQALGPGERGAPASDTLSLEDARSTCEAWRVDYNEVRPHSAIGQKTPAELARASGQACLP